MTKVRSSSGEPVARRTAHRPRHGALLLAGLPRQPVRAGRTVVAVPGPAFAPLADGLGADAEAAGQDAGALGGAGDLGAHSRGGAGVGVDREHRVGLTIASPCLEGKPGRAPPSTLALAGHPA